ncbi:hypothetical protein LAV_00205 [Sphingobium phage Lacusarx]|uniref:Uncharacterized protein n=1 Tax=Sphingobium phage Lacusarx TaxID=1980139 RepID=A0A1W6DX42_9CAUD|nr:hypothetical protein FDH44_gp098 [Sphingobium phage Lacusarx]ARK07580.1 hypothetical protein LAV_00205 [Sphingobium phage Lacusarx]
MASHNIGYHTRKAGQNSVKVAGGSFGGGFDLETANRLVKAHFTVAVKPSGSLVFVDREGREVTLYVTVDPAATEAGKAALAADQRRREIARKEEEGKREELERLLDDMSLDDALHLLRGQKKRP